MTAGELSPACRIVMVGPRGERDYLERILDNGVPCICGDDPAYAGVFHKDCAELVAAGLRRDWLFPHVAVELEPVADHAADIPVATSEIIEVTCFVFPDGATHWAESDTCEPQKVVDAWKARLPAEKRALYAECLGGVVRVRMPREDYYLRTQGTPALFLTVARGVEHLLVKQRWTGVGDGLENELLRVARAAIAWATRSAS